MNAPAARALAAQYGADHFLIAGRPETGPWLAHPARVAELTHALMPTEWRDSPADLGLADEALATAWACDLLQCTDIGVRRLNAALGPNLSALVRMASREIRHVAATNKDSAVFWRVAGRAPAPVRAAAACALLVRMETADQWPALSRGDRWLREALEHAPAHVGDLQRVSTALLAATREFDGAVL